MRLTLLGCGVLVCCGKPPPPTPAEPPPTAFIALGSDFEGFRDWNKFDLGGSTADAGALGLHIAGHRTVYVNRLPPHGATTFPTGTIAVKVIEDEVSGATQVFAMAKRGPTFNPTGAVGWEWFELASPTGDPVLKWRGPSSPTTGAYAGSLVTCNDCHVSNENDSVKAPPLALDTF